MRGKRDVGHAQVHDGRIIPAHAGQTRSARSPAKPPPDHPRACGANNTGPAQAASDIGSSPRMRGKRTMEFWTPLAGRIIPAHAGQTRRHVGIDRAAADHPRACGANGDHSKTLRNSFGSSPRMRGKRYTLKIPYSAVRIIPAHAGQTTYGMGGAPPNGSSPRMRGKHILINGATHEIRIIPAHAGQTC